MTWPPGVLPDCSATSRLLTSASWETSNVRWDSSRARPAVSSSSSRPMAVALSCSRVVRSVTCACSEVVTSSTSWSAAVWRCSRYARATAAAASRARSACGASTSTTSTVELVGTVTDVPACSCCWLIRPPSVCDAARATAVERASSTSVSISTVPVVRPPLMLDSSPATVGSTRTLVLVA